MRCDGLVAEVADWAAGLEEVHAQIAGRFTRAEPRARVLVYLRGLLDQLDVATKDVVDSRAAALPPRPRLPGGLLAGQLRLLRAAVAGSKDP
jgi:hypothetical protein